MHSVKINGEELSKWGLVIADKLPKIQSPKTTYRLVQLKNRIIGKYEKQIERESGSVSFTLNGIFKNLADFKAFNSTVYSKLTTDPLHVLEFDDEPGIEYLVRLDTSSKELLSGSYGMGDGQKLIIKYDLKFTIDLERSKIRAVATSSESVEIPLPDSTGWVVIAIDEDITPDGELGYPVLGYDALLYKPDLEFAYKLGVKGPHIRRTGQYITPIDSHDTYKMYKPQRLNEDVTVNYDPFTNVLYYSNGGVKSVVGHLAVDNLQNKGQGSLIDATGADKLRLTFYNTRNRKIIVWEVK